MAGFQFYAWFELEINFLLEAHFFRALHTFDDDSRSIMGQIEFLALTIHSWKKEKVKNHKT